jgi:hypothetical protein
MGADQKPGRSGTAFLIRVYPRKSAANLFWSLSRLGEDSTLMRGTTHPLPQVVLT